MAERWGKRGNWQILFSWIPKSLWTVIAAMKLKDTCSLEGKLMTNLERVLQSESITLPTKVHIFKAIVFPIVMYGSESWTIRKTECLKNWCFQIVVLEKTLESPLDSKIKLVSTKGNQPSIFIGRTDAEAEAPILWPPDSKSQLVGKDPDARKDWGQEEKGVTENELIWWHYWLNGHEFE